MAELATIVTQIILYLLPMYFANSSATIFAGKTQIDFGRMWIDKKPVFGSGKTWRGLIYAVVIGTLVGFVLHNFLPEQTALLTPRYIELSFLLALGAMLGDLAASFIKRRHGLKRGEQVLLLDQLDFVVGGMIVGSVIYLPDFYEAIAMCVATIVVHRVTNWLAFRLKIKNEPW